MSRFEEFRFPSADQSSSVYVRCCLPDGPVRGTLQLTHGIAEYIQRYDPLMQFLADEGWAVYGNDHIGHGQTAQHLGYVGEHSGWSVMVSDMVTLHRTVVQRHPHVPHFLFGHSMGSFLARTFIIKYGSVLDGCILSGTAHPPKTMIMGAKVLAALEVKRHGAGYHSPLLQSVMNGQYNGGYDNPRTAFDWISSDPNMVDAYIADPLCGTVPTAGLVSEVLRGMLFITNRRNIEKMSPDLPVFFISGADDPVGELSHGVIRAYRSFLKAKVQDVSLQLYPGLRHEILNDVGKGEVMDDILCWLNEEPGEIEIPVKMQVTRDWTERPHGALL